MKMSNLPARPAIIPRRPALVSTVENPFESTPCWRASPREGVSSLVNHINASGFDQLDKISPRAFRQQDRYCRFRRSKPFVIENLLDGHRYRIAGDVAFSFNRGREIS